jgi:hypothetical protein
MGRYLLHPLGRGNATGGTEAAALFYAFAVSPFSPLHKQGYTTMQLQLFTIDTNGDYVYWHRD